MTKTFAFAAVFLLLTMQVFADDFVQKGDPDVSKFPEITFKINIFDPTVKNKNVFNLKENNKDVDFNIKILPVDKVSGSKTLLILLEDMSESTHPGQKAFFRELLLKALDEIVQPGDKVNIALFDRSRKGEPVIRKLLDNYTDDIVLLKEKVKTYKSIDDLWYRCVPSDLYAAVCDGLIEIKSTSFNQKKMVLLLSAGKNNNEGTESNPDRAIKLAQQNRIPVYSVQYYMQGWEHNRVTTLIESTYGKEVVINKSQVAIDSLISFMKAAPQRLYGQDYEFTFTTSNAKDNKVHILELSIDYISGNVRYQSPEPEIDYLMISIIGGCGLIVITVLGVILFKKNKKKRLARENEKQAEIQQQFKNAERTHEEEQKKFSNEMDSLKKQNEEEKRIAHLQRQLEEEKKKKEELRQEMKASGRFARLNYRFDNIDYTFEIKEPKISIGRESTNDMPIPASTMSRNHCYVYYSDKQYYLKNLSETNPAKINGRAQDEVELNHGDVIELGEISIVFYC